MYMYMIYIYIYIYILYGEYEVERINIYTVNINEHTHLFSNLLRFIDNLGAISNHLGFDKAIKIIKTYIYLSELEFKWDSTSTF